jgi:hypothetical protein
VLWGVIHILSSYAKNILVQGVAVWAPGGQNSLGTELWDIHLAALLGCHGIMQRQIILLEDVLTSSSNAIHLEDLHVLLGNDVKGPNGPPGVMGNKVQHGGQDVAFQDVSPPSMRLTI